MRRARWSVGAVVLIAVAATAGAVLVVLRSSLKEIETGAAPEASAILEGDTGFALESAPEAEARPAKSTPRELPDGVWIRGRVVVPAGTPADEKVEIAARVLSFDDAPGYVAEMGADGGFAVMFPKEVDSGWIEVHARYLVLEPNQPVDLEEPPEEIVLEPVLGGRVRGRIVGPGRSEVRAPAGTTVELSANTGPGFRRFAPRRVLVGEDLRFEFPALPPIDGYELAMKAKDFLPFRGGVAVVPGATADVEIDLHAGVRVSGQVLDPDGKPVQGAVVWRTERAPRWSLQRSDADTSSGPDGAFVMTAIPPGVVSISFKADRCLPEVVSVGRLEDGDVREGLVVRLRPGLVQGRVEWPDGTPAFDAVVELRSYSGIEDQQGLHLFGRIPMSVHNGGRFAVEAMTEGPYSLFARSPGTTEVDPDDPAATGGSGIALLEEVRPSTVPVVLVLQPSPILRGRVVDDLGNPVEHFTVRGNLAEERMYDTLTGSATGAFDHPGGAFAFAGLAPGNWTFRACVHQRASGPDRRVVLPNQGEPIVLVIPRTTTVSGIVVDPEDHPVAFAEIQSPARSTTVSDEEGRFELSDLAAGELVIRATAKSFAPSEQIRLRTEPGGSSTGIRLVMRRGGAIVCDVVDENGDPEPHRRVDRKCPGGDWFEEDGDTDDETDEDGRLVIEDLAPGSYTLVRVPTYQEQEGSRAPGPNLWTRFAAARTQVSLDVVEGAVTRVVLGGPKGSPVRVRGRVTDRGAPVAGVAVQGVLLNPAFDQSSEGTTDTNGRFELLVPEPGDLDLSLVLGDHGIELMTRRRVVEGSSEELDLSLPQGRVLGVVRSSDDRPAEGADLWLSSEGDVQSIGGWSASAWTESAAGGRFEFRNLPGGRCLLRSSVETDPLSPPLERPTTELILPEGGVLDDVVIRLP